MRVLVVGDIIGNPGREILKKYLLKHITKYDLVIVNGENSAGGFGITQKVAEEFFDMGVDVITGGNHIWDKREIYDYLNKEIRVLRPYNYPKGVPGRGSQIFKTKRGEEVGIINLQGRVFMTETDSPFEKGKEAVEELKKKCKIIIIDFHAEATSEKIALGWYMDGEVSLVYGTHTHVLTADDRVLPKGTGYISDVGMTGGFEGIIGMKRDKVIDKFLTGMPNKFEICTENVRLNGIEVDIDSTTGKCIDIVRLNLGEMDLR